MYYTINPKYDYDNIITIRLLYWWALFWCTAINIMDISDNNNNN